MIPQRGGPIQITVPPASPHLGQYHHMVRVQEAVDELRPEEWHAVALEMKHQG
jgi:hypothetical protein